MAAIPNTLRLLCRSVMTVTMLLFLLVVAKGSSVTAKTVPYKINLLTYEKWICKTPQLRVVHLRDLDGITSPNEVYIPSALVIHRCDQSTGCCRYPGHVCQPTEKEEIIHFVIKAHAIRAHAVSSRTQHKHKKHQRKMVVPLLNHTSCECRPANINDRPRRSLEEELKNVQLVHLTEAN